MTVVQIPSTSLTAHNMLLSMLPSIEVLDTKYERVPFGGFKIACATAAALLVQVNLRQVAGLRPASSRHCLALCPAAAAACRA
jgi:hypothetical protein